MSNQLNSYRDILRSSSVMGAAQGLNYLVALVRVKMIAVLLGPSGVGLVSLYTSTIGLVGTVSGLGIGNSGVREVALAFSQHDTAAAARTVRILRRACWITGLLGWALAAALAPLLGAWALGSAEHTAAVAVLGVTLFLGALGVGQTALLQGTRRIGDIARTSVITMILNTGVAVGLYAWLGERGIVPVLVVTAAVSLAVSWWYARRIHVDLVVLSWPDTLSGTRRLAGLGLAFMWSALLVAGMDLATRSLITRQVGIDAAGLYQAAWAMSGLFASFILTAMGTDFYPRLASVITDEAAAIRLVNEQTEVGILLALPGLLGTLAFAPWLMEIFYTEQFVPAAVLLPWFVLGMFGRIVSWPLGFVQLAKGAGWCFVLTETLGISLQLSLTLWMLPHLGLIGVAHAFAITYFTYTSGMLYVARVLINFSWNMAVKKLVALSAVAISAGLMATIVDGYIGLLLGGSLTLITTVFALRGLARRLQMGCSIRKIVAKVLTHKWLATSPK